MSRIAGLLLLLVCAVGGLAGANPTVTAIATQTTNEDTTIVVNFTIADTDETNGDVLTVTGVSFDDSKVDDADVTFPVTTGFSRQVSLVPQPDANGSVTIQLTVTDPQGNNTQRTFTLNITAVNDSPTITAISPQTINEDGNTGDLSFTIGDVETTSSSLTLSAASTNTTLLPVANITFGGGGPSRTVRATPVANGNGTATVTVTVADGTDNASRSFLLTVTGQNDTPTLSTVSTLTGGSEDTPYTVTYAALLAASNASDIDGDALAFRIEAVSGGTLTKGGVAVVTGSTTLATGETLVWTPPTGANGGSVNAFTVKARDPSGALSSGTPQVSVALSAVNDPPTITAIADQSINEDGNTGDLAFTIGDAETSSGSLVVSAASTNTTLLPVANVTFGGSGSSRTVRATPVAGLSGSSTVTVTVSDGTLSATEVFVVNVAAVNDVPTISSVTTLPGGIEDSDFIVAYATLLAASNAADADGDTLVFRVESVSTGQLRKGGLAVVAGTTTLAAGETLVWSPAANASGANVNAFTVRVVDPAPAVSSGSAQVSVAVTAVNDAPSLTTITTLGGGTEDTAYPITYAALQGVSDEADADSDPLVFLVASVASGGLTKGGVAVTPGVTIVGSGESLLWTPPADANGVTAAFSLQVRDPSAALSAGPVLASVNLTAVNDGPPIGDFATTVTHFLDSGYTALVAGAETPTLVDVDATTFNNARVEARLTTGFTSAEDELAVRTVIAAHIYKSGGSGIDWRDAPVAPTINVNIGTWGYNTGTGTLTVTFNGNATLPRVLDLLKALHYSNTFGAGATSTADRTVTLRFFEGDNAVSPVIPAKLVRVRPQNNVPVVNIGQDADRFSVGLGQQKAISALNLSVTDESAPVALVYRLVSLPAFGTLRKGTLASSVAIISTAETFTQRDIIDGKIIYRHNGTLVASDSFQFFVDDGERITQTNTFPIGIGTDRGQAIVSDPIVVIQQNTGVGNIIEVPVLLTAALGNGETVVADNGVLPAQTLDPTIQEGKLFRTTFDVVTTTLGYQRFVIRIMNGGSSTGVEQIVIVRIAVAADFDARTN